MKIEETNCGSRFYIPIPASLCETEDDFLRKARNCLTSFFEKYTKMTEQQKQYKHPFRNSSLDSLKGQYGALNFSELELDGIADCDIDFHVRTPQDNDARIGIDIFASTRKPQRKIMMDFLREKWKEFDYRF